jgi:hypothetical protein
MAGDLAHRFFEKLLSRRNFVPGRRTGRMRQRNQIEDVTGAARAKPSADHLFQFRAFNELRDGESSDRNDQARFENLYFLVHPRRAIPDFIRRWDAIGPAGRFSWETSANRCEIKFRAHRGFVHPAKLFEPPEKCLTSSVSERTPQARLARTGRLADYHHIADDCSAGNRFRFHSLTPPAFSQRRDMSI